MNSDLLQTLVEDPTRVFSKEVKDSEFFDGLVKTFIDPITNYSKLDEIYIDGLDASQIFGQSRLVVQNAGQAVMEKLDELKEELSDAEVEESESGSEESEADELYVRDEHINDEEIEEEIEEEVGEEGEEEEEEESDHFGDDDEGENEEEVENLQEQPISVKKDAFGLNDEFFDIDEFNKQVLALENENDDEDDEEVDLFAEIEDDDEIDYFDDFYDKPNQVQPIPAQEPKKSLLDDESDISDGAEEEGSDVDSLNDEEFNHAIGEMRQDLYEEKSTFEKQQEKLQREIGDLEDELVAEKKWTMKGEVKSAQRPEDSLLNDEEDFDFDRVAKPVPIITEEVTESIEDLIRKRIKNDEFDDLPKRFLNEVVKPRKQRVEVSETKSAKSLAEIYEDKYQGVEDNEKEEQLTKDHLEIQQLFNKVNYTLDSLTSFNFVPKPYENKVIEVKNATIDMEDAQPEFVSSENRLAPQEVFKQDEKNADEISLKSGLSYSRDELSRDDKQRLRRANKRKKAKQFKDSEPKKSKKQSMVDTLSGNKNLTIINKSGQKTDVKGNVKKTKQVSSNNLKL